MAGRESALLGIGCGGKGFSNRVERLHVRRRVRPRRAANRRLIHHLEFRDRRVAFNSLADVVPVSAGALGLQSLVQNVVKKRGFPGTGYARDGRDRAKRDHNVHILQIVASRTDDF